MDLIGLQKIDCNCSDCIFMQRDVIKYKRILKKAKQDALDYFNKLKDKEIAHCNYLINNPIDEAQRKSALGMLRVAKKMRFEFSSIHRINYGYCTKEEKEVSFIQGVCQIDTQKCFKHRRD